MGAREKQVLVTGASGFVGSNLVRRLANEGTKVRATYWKRSEAVPKLSGIEPARCDLTDRDDCKRAVDGCDVVFMCAAQTSGAAVIRGNPLEHVTPNILMNVLMLEAAYDAGVSRFVFLSTGCVYPDTSGIPAKEDDAFSGPPHDVYFAAGWMKRYSELLCRLYSEKVESKMSCIVVRPSNIYGPGDKFGWRTSHVTAAQIRKAFERQKPIEVWGTGDDIRDVIYIDDFIDGLITASTVDESYFEVNIASGVGVSVREIVNIALDVAGHTAKIETNRLMPTTVPVVLFDTDRARKKLGFKAKVDLPSGIARTLAWLERTPKKVWDR